MNIALLFPGYGSQHVGMGEGLCNKYPIALECFEQASKHVGIDFNELCFSESGIDVCVSAPEGEFCFSGRGAPIHILNNAYLGIFVMSYAIFKILQEHGIEPTCVAGYDTGQYAAICAANGISFLQGLDLLKVYAEYYMDLLEKGGYDIIKINGITSTQLPKYLNSTTSIAAYQARTQHLVSGTKEGIAGLEKKLRNASRASIYHEGVGLGLNSELMKPVVEKFRPHLKEVSFQDISIPVISNVNANLVTQGDQIKQELIKLITTPVRWDKVVDELSSVDVILGIGHEANLLDLVKEKYPDKICIALCKAEDVKRVKDMMN